MDTTRRAIVEMGMVCARLGLTPETVQGVVHLGADAQLRGVTQDDILDLWRIKIRIAERR